MPAIEAAQVTARLLLFGRIAALPRIDAACGHDLQPSHP
jgi:hypothetical protein